MLLLNDDTEVISGGWLEARLEHAQKPGGGAVGAKLIYSRRSHPARRGCDWGRRFEPERLYALLSGVPFRLARLHGHPLDDHQLQRGNRSLHAAAQGCV